LSAFTTIGCGPRADVQLIQPSLPEWQRQIHLQSELAFWASDGKALRVLAEFPLPGATTGKPTYLLYFTVAHDKNAPPNAQQRPKVRGFFIQTRGEYAGLASIVRGKTKVKGSSNARGATRHLDIELNFEDGSKVAGKIRARRDEWHMNQFETRRRPADVQTLKGEKKVSG